MRALALNFLTTLEQREARLLCWGYVDGGFALDEVVALGERYAADHDPTGEATGEALVEHLRDTGLLLEVDRGSDFVYRSLVGDRKPPLDYRNNKGD